MRRFLPLLLLCALLCPLPASAAPKKALFDNTHQETAGNADWQIDTDQPVPLPDQSGITPATPESYWYGAISAWGVSLVKKGYTVHTLTTSYGITYGNAGNPYDLSNYDLFIVDEPNTIFTRAESTAIFNYLREGGGMFAVCDHAGSDRNSDGVDSPKAWGRLDQLHLLGAHFDSTGEGSSSTNNFTQNSGNIDNSVLDSLIYGPVGFADSISFHNGTSMHLFPATNPSVKAAMWQNGLSHTSTSGVMVAYASYGKGRVVFVGDSSPCDDGSAVSGNSSIYNGWAEATGRDSILFMNGSLWATRNLDTAAPTVTVLTPNGGESVLQGSDLAVSWTASDNVGVTTVDLDYSLNGAGGPWTAIAHGIANTGGATWTTPLVASDSVMVRVRAVDAANNAATDACDGLVHITAPVRVGAPGTPAAFDVAAWAVGQRVRFAVRVPSAGRATLVVRDVAGRTVWRDARWLTAGVTALEWDGRLSSGAPAAHGVYAARCSGPWGGQTVRVLRAAP